MGKKKPLKQFQSSSLQLNLYYDLLSGYKEAYPEKDHGTCVQIVSVDWAVIKKTPNVKAEVNAKIKDYHDQAPKTKRTLKDFWTAQQERPPIPLEKPPVSPDVGCQMTEATVEDVLEDLGTTSVVEKKTPAQDVTKKELETVIIDIDYLKSKEKKQLATADELKKLRTLTEKKKKLKERLRKLKGNRDRQKRHRENQKIKLANISLINPDVASVLQKRQAPGRPRLEEFQEGLHETILDIISYGSQADDRRRSEIIRTCKTLDDLTNELRLRGYTLSRSAAYLRLQPRRRDSTEGLKHVKTVPVKLMKATNTLHKKHSDTVFCRATIGQLEELASLLGPNDVIFMSQDDKSRVPLGITAANKQAPILMHFDYRVKLPDHDWVVAERHKLIPSVYAFMEIESGKFGDPKAVKYSGPTFISIRSGKHSSSTAGSHSNDLNTILQLDQFSKFCKREDGVKPVLIVITDGGPDENPRYEKVMNMAISHFIKYDLDAIFLATNAPGRSAFNRVERRMAPLSKELSGVILPYDTFGSHLNERGATIDTNLEMKNFGEAGKILAEIWGKTVIDGYPTTTMYVEPNENSPDEIKVDAKWKVEHVREGHYFFQVVKCNNTNCCKPRRSSIFKIIDHFFPAPMCVSQSSLSLYDNKDLKNEFSSLLLRIKLCDESFKVKGLEVPFDLCCPSLTDIISQRLCQKCGLYHSSLKTLKEHVKGCKRVTQQTSADPVSIFQSLKSRPIRVAARRQREKMIVWTSRLNDKHADWVDNDELEGLELQDTTTDTNQDSIPVITINDYMSQVWEVSGE